MTRCIGLGFTFTLAWWLSGRAWAQPAWDGFDRLKALAQRANIALPAPSSVDLSAISANDAFLIVSPRRELPAASLTAFLRDGGRMALLDDTGTGERLLAAYQVERVPPPTRGVPALRDDPKLLIAYPSSIHPLVADVPLLLTNRAAALRHADLKPVFTFGRTDSAFVIAGAIGKGRLVAVGDASVLLNQVMRAPSHRQFARNLLAYLHRPGARVWFIGPDTTLRGSYGAQASRGLSRIDAWLKRIAHPDLPPRLVYLLSLLACLGTAAVAAGVFPRRSPYAKADLFPDPALAADPERTRALVRAGDLAAVLQEYRVQLEASAAEELGLDLPYTRDQVELAMAGRGMARAEAGAFAAALVALSARASEPAKDVDVFAARNVIGQGEALLARIESTRP